MKPEIVSELVAIKSRSVHNLTIARVEDRARIAFLTDQFRSLDAALTATQESTSSALADACLFHSRSCALILVKRACGADDDSARRRWIVDTTIDTVVAFLNESSQFAQDTAQAKAKIVLDVYGTAFDSVPVTSDADLETSTFAENLQLRVLSMFNQEGDSVAQNI